MLRNSKLQLSFVLGILFVMGTVPTVYSDDDHGRGGRGGHGGHGGNNHSQNFFGLGPEGFTYGYRNDNFGLLIGPVGGGQQNRYHAAPMYGPPGGYVDPGFNGYGGSVGPVVSAPIVTSANPLVAAPVPASDAPSYSGDPGSLAESFYRQSVDAFRGGEYDRATRLADHAIVEDSNSGLLRLLAAQCLLATGEFEAAATALVDGLPMLAQSQWGKEVKNFRALYKQNDYVTHIKRLEKFAAENPQVAYGNALCAYHFHFLGHADAARRHLEAARNADAEDALVKLLNSAIEPESAEVLPAPISILVPAK